MAPSGDQFVHLHVHTQYSLLDGACRASDLVKRAKEHGQSSVAITDHGCLFGVVDFYLKAVAEGIKPIVGIEAYMAGGARTDRTSTGVKDGGYHLLLLAQNLQGYKNLLKLSSIAYTEGFYYKPRIDKEVLKAHAEGLICTSACLGGEIPTALTNDNRKKAKEIAETYLEVFGADRFFIELQKHIPEQDRVNPELIDLADRLGIGTVATNDVHFLLPDDHGPHNALCCISTGRLITDETRLVYPTQLYLKSSPEMYQAWDHPKWREACANTVKIADMCNLELNFKASYPPTVKIMEQESGEEKGAGTPAASAVGSTEWFKNYCQRFMLEPFDALNDQTPKEELKKQCDDALRKLAEAGAVWRYGPPERGRFTPEHRARLERELKILADKNISAYFLIVWDFVNEARRRGIPAMARGSGVGTMVGYVLGLSNACPIDYGLLFERFTDPDRSEYPDIDVDMCQDGRQEIIEYVRQKYKHVAQIITFGTMKARNAIRDVGRVMGVPIPDVDKVCKLVGDKLGTTIKSALEQEPDLKKLYDESPTHRELIDTAKRLEGLARHAGVHAAGVIIATQPLTNLIPLYQPAGTDQIVTQWDGPTCEKVGLLKMDFLGLRTLSIIEKARQIIRQSLPGEVIRRTVEESRRAQKLAALEEMGIDPLELERLPFDDQKVLEVFRRGETAGMFQFESGGMRNLLVAMKPDRLEDLIAANALYRPGPMDLIPDYCDRKHGRKPVPKVHPIVDQFTAETYGIMVYQEQVMQVVHGLGGIPLRAAYTLIKNISKKKQKDIDAVRPTFIAGAQKNGLTKAGGEELFDLILKFAGYGFNKSHSTGYAIIAYQTAYLKTYFPVPYMAAVLTYESVSTDKVVEYMDECRRVQFPDGHRGIDVRPPDINLSDIGFNVVFDKDEPRDSNHGHIRFGLSAVKGVGDKAVQAIIDARKKENKPFASIFDFCERIPLGSVNRATMEALIKCGAFDALHGMPQRAAVAAALDSAIAVGQRAAADRATGQLNMFGMAEEPADAAKAGAKVQGRLPATTPWAPAEQTKFEKDVLGFYITSHPLDQHKETLRRFANADCTDIDKLAADVEVVLGGMLTRVKTTVTKNGKNPGQKMAMLTLEDASGSMEAVIFSAAYAVAAPLLEVDKVVFLKGRVDRRRERPSVIIEQVLKVEEAIRDLTRTVIIRLDGAGKSVMNGGELENLRDLLRRAAFVPPRSSAPAGGGGKGFGWGRRERSSAPSGAEVILEVRQEGKAVRLKCNQGRITATPDLPQRVAQVLRAGDARSCCELRGPARLLQSEEAARFLHQAAAETTSSRLERQTSDDEFCDSIDRY